MLLSAIATALICACFGYLIGHSRGYGEGLKDGVGIRGYFVEPPTGPHRRYVDLTPFDKEKHDGPTRHEDQRENQKG